MISQTQDNVNDRSDELFRVTIHIADTEPVQFEIERSEERLYREAEYHVNQLWKKWSKSDPKRSTADILARVALAFAELYYRKKSQFEEQHRMIDDFERELDRLLDSHDD
ncbi:MAG: cell division protein ZapA [Muribaculaceae bacterium]|nr:cell division protein ZapA [Muribaculaceae bacterium]MDE6131392.1 cell division protein ZapA [Muribaculaceae bacterium]